MFFTEVKLLLSTLHVNIVKVQGDELEGLRLYLRSLFLFVVFSRSSLE